MARSTTEKSDLSGSTFTLAPKTTEIQDFAPSTIRPTEDERADSMEKLMKDEKKVSDRPDLITQFYPDYEYESEESENTVSSSTKKVRFKSQLHEFCDFTSFVFSDFPKISSDNFDTGFR